MIWASACADLVFGEKEGEKGQGAQAALAFNEALPG